MRYTRYSNDDIIKAIRLLALNLGRVPVARDFTTFRGGNKWGVINRTTIFHRIGPLEVALKQAGVTEVLPRFIPTGVLTEGPTCHHPLDAIFDRLLHHRGLPHHHYVFTKEWVGPHPLVFPLLIERNHQKYGVLWGPSIKANDVMYEEWIALTDGARRWLQRKMAGRLAIVFADNLITRMGELIDEELDLAL